MKKRLVRLLIVMPVLMLGLLSARAAVAVPYYFTPFFLRSFWIFRMAPAKSFAASAPGDPGGVATASRQDILRVGFIHWDGAGGASGRTIATTDNNSGSTVIIDFTWTGTYTVNPDGTGSLNVTPAVTDASCTPSQPTGVCATFEGNETYALVINKYSGQVSLNQTNNAGGAKIFMTAQAVRQFNNSALQYPFSATNLRKRWTFQLEPATSFAANAPGDPGGVATAPRQNLLRVGYIDWDGFGGASGHTIATTDDNAGNTVIIDFTWTGTYAINLDGTGTLSVTPFVTDASCTPAQPAGVCTTFEGAETYAFAASKSRPSMYLAETDNAGGGAKIFMGGQAKVQ